MALKPCKECGRRVSATKATCRHCGARLRKGGLSVGRVIGGVIVVLLFVSVVLPFVIGLPFGGKALAARAIVDEDMVVPKDKFYFQSVTVKKPLEVKVIVERKAGPTVDVYCLNDADFGELQELSRMFLVQGDAEPDTFNAALSSESLTGRYESDWVPLNTGTHHIVIDNTYYGPSEPGEGEQGAAVYVKIVARPR